MKNVNYNKIAKKVIETEINSLKKLKLNLNKSFEKAVKTILNCKNGKIVIVQAELGRYFTQLNMHKNVEFWRVFILVSHLGYLTTCYMKHHHMQISIASHRLCFPMGRGFH